MNPFGNKFGHIKKVEIDGIIFDSKKESKMYEALKAQKERGEIRSFLMQVVYILIPKQTEPVTVMDKKGRPVIKQKIVEHACTYKADFVVTDNDGDVEVIDCKGNRALDSKWPIKRKLMRHVHGIAVREV